MELDAINTEATLTVLPGGTRNVLVKSLNLPDEFEECCKVVTSSSSTKKIDVIATTLKEPRNNSNYVCKTFLNAAEIGFGVEIIDRSKTMGGKISSRILSTFTGIVTTLPTYKSNTCEVIEDSIDSNKTINKITKMTMGIVANGSFIGGGFQAATKADMSDGLLDTIIVKNSDSFKILNKLGNIKKGEESITNDKDIHYGQSQTVALISESKNNITVSVDGEPIGILPAFFRIFPQLLKIKS